MPVTRLLIPRLACAGILSAALLAGLLRPAMAAEKTKIVLTGSSTLAPLASSLATAFESKNTAVLVEIQTGGSSKGVADCKTGLNDLGMISRTLNSSEKGAESIPVARDGLALLVAKSLGVKSLAPEQILGIYKGRIKNWKDVGGLDLPIIAVSKAEGRGTLELFKESFQLKSSEIKAGLIVGDEAHGVKTIESSKGSIGYVGLASATQATSVKDASLSILEISGVAPSFQTIRSGRYAYSRNLQFVKCKSLSPSAQAFLDFALGAEGQKVVESLGYIPL